MKLLRIRLRDWRGIGDREIDLAPVGVTVVEGPNEIGKSSIAEAIDLLLGELDSTTKANVKAIKPVDRDAGPEVELELETGPYRLVYRKRFLKRAETILEVLTPRHENLTGREAHERVRRILDETVDEGLWKALRITQGKGISQADLMQGHTPSLAAALDRAAGTAPTTGGERSLFDRVREEYLRYWTEKGHEKAEAGVLRRSLEEQEGALATIEDALRRLEHDIDESARLRTEIERLKRASIEAQARAKALGEAAQRIGELKAVAARADAGAREAQHAFEAAEAGSKARRDAITALAEGAAQRDRLVAALAESAPQLDSVRERAEAALGALATARAERTAAEAEAKLRRADLAVLRDTELLQDWRARLERVEAARAALVRAEAILASNRVDAKALAGIVAAERELAAARARLEVAGAALRIEPLAPVELIVDGVATRLEPGTPFRRPIEAETKVVLPGILELELRAGSGDGSLRNALHQAEAAFRAACEAAGAAGLAEAQSAATERTAAEASGAEQVRIIIEALGPKGLESLPRLEERIATAEHRIAEHAATRPATPEMAAGMDAAQQAAEEADELLENASRAVETAEIEETAARRRLEELRADRRDAEVAAQVATESTERLAVGLATARAATPDEALERARADAATALSAAAATSRAATSALDEAAPDRTAALLENAEKVREDATRSLRATEDRQLEVETRLREHGEDGLAEQRDRAITLRDAAARDLERHRAAADARKLLYETMSAARDRVRRAYVAPLRERVIALGGIVFGPGFDVELTEDLRIASRTLNGRTIPFESLSIGTQEQLGIVLRLACAIAVAPDGGVPIILDDALGYADPVRLEVMGAVLAQAGRSCQVVVLTCHPDRYRLVGGATFVHLAPELPHLEAEAVPL